jgi:hypothetical protein
MPTCRGLNDLPYQGRLVGKNKKDKEMYHAFFT